MKCVCQFVLFKKKKTNVLRTEIRFFAWEIVMYLGNLVLRNPKVLANKEKVVGIC